MNSTVKVGNNVCAYTYFNTVSIYFFIPQILI